MFQKRFAARISTPNFIRDNYNESEVISNFSRARASTPLRLARARPRDFVAVPAPQHQWTSFAVQRGRSATVPSLAQMAGRQEWAPEEPRAADPSAAGRRHDL